MKWYHFLPIFLATCVLAIILNFIPVTVEDVNNDLPTINISLSDTELSEMIDSSKDIKYPDNQLTLTTNNQTYNYEDVEIKGHGNSTWGLSKSPFQIKFKTKVDLLGMGKAKKWILLANFLDKSNLRTDIAFYLERMLNENYALEGRFVNLYIDDEYQGLYYLTEKVEIDKNRINLKDEYGIIVELENLHANKEDCYRTEIDTCLIIQDLVNENNKKVSINQFVTDFNKLEKAAKAGDYDAVKQLIDVTSFAKYFLLSEFTINPDAYASSFFFYKDGLDDKIHAGPGWDFDYSLGNQTWNWSRVEDYYLPEGTRITELYSFGGEIYDKKTDKYIKLTPDNTISKLIFYLYRIPEFKAEVEKIYREQMMGKKAELLSFIRAESSLIRDAAIQDNELWHEANLAFSEKLNQDAEGEAKDIFHNNIPAEEAFDLEVNYLLDWVNRRFDYFDYEYSGLKDYPNYISLVNP